MWKEKNLFHPRNYSPSWREAQAGNQREILKQKQRRKVAYWLALSLTLNQLSYATQDYMHRGCTAHSGLGPPISIINQENGHRPIS